MIDAASALPPPPLHLAFHRLFRPAAAGVAIATASLRGDEPRGVAPSEWGHLTSPLALLCPGSVSQRSSTVPLLSIRAAATVATASLRGDEPRGVAPPERGHLTSPLALPPPSGLICLRVASLLF